MEKELDVILVINDRGGKYGWTRVQNDTVVYSYDPDSKDPDGVLVMSEADGGRLFIYGPTFQGLVDRLKIFGEPLNEVCVGQYPGEPIMRAMTILADAGLFGSNTRLTIIKNHKARKTA